MGGIAQLAPQPVAVCQTLPGGYRDTSDGWGHPGNGPVPGRYA